DDGTHTPYRPGSRGPIPSSSPRSPTRLRARDPAPRGFTSRADPTSTSLLLPFELYEVIEQVSVLRIGVLLLNLAIVAYLVSQLRRHTLRSRT
ncbi:MAG TPA: DUF2127 domain-containing protein, partial [Nitrospiraceae bacterium]|nr:DUF2127 domain-containing protein [Nitrospiraceae bacterium]